MLNVNQVTRLLKQCENINIESEKNMPDGSPVDYKYFEYMRNIGWCQALRLVLEKDTYPISKKPFRKDPIDEYDEREEDE